MKKNRHGIIKTLLILFTATLFLNTRIYASNQIPGVDEDLTFVSDLAGLIFGSVPEETEQQAPFSDNTASDTENATDSASEDPVSDVLESTDLTTETPVEDSVVEVSAKEEAPIKEEASIKEEAPIKEEASIKEEAPIKEEASIKEEAPVKETESSFVEESPVEEILAEENTDINDTPGEEETRTNPEEPVVEQTETEDIIGEDSEAVAIAESDDDSEDESAGNSAPSVPEEPIDGVLADDETDNASDVVDSDGEVSVPEGDAGEPPTLEDEDIDLYEPLMESDFWDELQQSASTVLSDVLFGGEPPETATCFTENDVTYIRMNEVSERGNFTCQLTVVVSGEIGVQGGKKIASTDASGDGIESTEEPDGIESGILGDLSSDTNESGENSEDTTADESQDDASWIDTDVDASILDDAPKPNGGAGVEQQDGQEEQQEPEPKEPEPKESEAADSNENTNIDSNEDASAEDSAASE